MRSKYVGKNAGYATSEITFYHVSAKRKFGTDNNEPYLPRRRFKIKVLLKQKFEFAYATQGEYLLSTMPAQFLHPKASAD